MKVTTLIALVLLCAAVALSVWVMCHPKIEVRIIEGARTPAGPPDKITAKKAVKTVPQEPTVTLDLGEIEIQPDTMPYYLSEKEFKQETSVGTIVSDVSVWSWIPADSIGNKIRFDGENEAIDRIKKEVAASIKPSKFWPGFALGVTTVSVLAITTLIITE